MIIMDSTNQIRLLPGHDLSKYSYNPGLGKTITHWTVLMQLVTVWLLCCSPCQTHKVGNSNMADCAAYLIGQAVVPNLITWMGNLHVWLLLERKRKNHGMHHLFITTKKLTEEEKVLFLVCTEVSFYSADNVGRQCWSALLFNHNIPYKIQLYCHCII